MKKPGKITSTNPNPKQSVQCDECKSNPSKYKCPGCSVRSCSLPCVKAHKLRTGCSGKREQTQFVYLSQFDDNILLSDYNLLEDVKRVADSAQRTREKLCGYSHFRVPYPLKILQIAAATRKTKLLFHSSGMSKRQTNRTFYNNRKKKQFISWTIEWRFHSTDVVLVDHGVNENKSICSVIEKHLRPGPWNHQLRQFCEEPLDLLKFFIRKYPQGAKSPFRELDIKAPIRKQLSNLVILEYPVIHVFLPSHSYDFEVINDTIPHKTEIKESVRYNHPSPKGVAFREEEIEDGSSTDPQVLDLMKLSSALNGTEKESNDKLDRPLLEKVAQGTKPVLENDLCICKDQDDRYFGLETEDPGEFEGMDFEFDQGLLDSFSDMIAQTNPADFLDLEGLFAEEVELEERGDNRDFIGVIPTEEELEEGEIRE